MSVYSSSVNIPADPDLPGTTQKTLKELARAMLKSVIGKMLNCIVGMGLLVLTSGCDLSAPRPRMGTLPTPPPGPRFSNPNNLGKHSYGFNPFEENGIVYTCKAGHLDITHLRWNADYTAYAVSKIHKTLMKKGKGFSFNLALEISTHEISFGYPENWDNLSRNEKNRIAQEIAFEIGPYVAFNATLWHEILTWFGVHFVGFEPEFNSAFSWEDMYSNLIGTELAVEALKNKNHDYDTALTLAIDRKLRELDVQPKSIAMYASEKMRDKWYKGYFLVDIIKKNVDIGLDDGHVTPVLVPGICDGAEPEPIPVPTTDILAKYGFSMKYEILPREWEKSKILKIVFPNGNGSKIRPDRHFPVIMDYIKNEAVQIYGYDID